jgi:hypothetical protein
MAVAKTKRAGCRCLSVASPNRHQHCEFMLMAAAINCEKRAGRCVSPASQPLTAINMD